MYLSLTCQLIKNNKIKNMRTEFISLFAELNAKELENLTKEVPETITVHTHAENAKPLFTAANLWNIHNMRKERVSRRMFFS